MEEKHEVQISETSNFAPAQAENANDESSEHIVKTVIQKEGQSEKSDPKEEMILGKFKSTEELAKAYEELQKQQGKASQEVGSLRKDLSDFSNLKELSSMLSSYQASIIPVIKRDKELYNTPEYFQNNIFNEMYTEALMVYGDNLDTDRMVNLLETYVKERIALYEKGKSAQDETQGVIDSMAYSKNQKTSISNPKKSLSEMTEAEFRESIRKLI